MGTDISKDAAAGKINNYITLYRVFLSHEYIDFFLPFRFNFYVILKMEATDFSKTLVSIYQTKAMSHLRRS
jgi:hypothetical protein